MVCLKFSFSGDFLKFIFTACSSFGILSLTVITHSILADTFFLPKRVKDIKLLSFHIQVFGFCFLKEGHILLFMFFYCPGNTEKERMVTSDARQRKQGGEKSVLPPVSSWRNLAKRVTFGVTKCKAFSPVFRWAGCCASFGICFCPRELSLEKIHAVLPFFHLYGWECLVFYLWGLLSYACWQQRMKQLKWHYSILIFALTTFFFLNKSDPFFGQKSSWMCAALSIFSWKRISLSTRIHFAALCKLQPALALAGVDHVASGCGLQNFMLLLTLYLHDCLWIAQVSCFLQSS